jgi:hypothetical protein
MMRRRFTEEKRREFEWLIHQKYSPDMKGVSRENINLDKAMLLAQDAIADLDDTEKELANAKALLRLISEDTEAFLAKGKGEEMPKFNLKGLLEAQRELFKKHIPGYQEEEEPEFTFEEVMATLSNLRKPEPSKECTCWVKKLFKNGLEIDAYELELKHGKPRTILRFKPRRSK